MRKIVIPFAVLLGLLLLGSTSLAVGPEKLWWTEFTSDVFVWSAEGIYTYMFIEESTGTPTVKILEVDWDAELYPGTVLIRPWHMQVRTDEPGLNCVTVDPPRIHPDQPVRFHVGWATDEPMSHQDAEDSFDSLSYMVFMDGGPYFEVKLERQGTHPAFEETDFTKAFCPWTVRP